MTELRSLVRSVRDGGIHAATFWKTTIDNDGIALSLDGMSTRMRSILLRGDYEREDARLARKYITAESRVLELGGSIGFVSLFCQKVLGVRDYALVEANPAMIDRLRANYALNGVRLPTVLNVVAGGADGRASFHVSGDFWSSSVVMREHDGAEVIEVEQMTIDTIVAHLPFQPDTLVMDIEGGETFIPAGHLARFDTIIAELHPHIVGEAPVRALIDGLAAHRLPEIERDDKTHVFRREVKER